MYNITLWHIRIMIIPPGLSQQPNTISLEESTLWQFNIIRKNIMYLGLPIKCLIFCMILTKFTF